MKFILFFIGIIYCSSMYAGSWTFNMKKNVADFLNSGVKILNASTSADIIVDDHIIKIVPEGNPIITETGVGTPLGKVIQKKYKWRCKGGYELIWDISNIQNSVYSIRTEFVNSSSKPVFLKRILMLETPVDGMTVPNKASDWMLASTDVAVRRWGTLDQRIPSEKELSLQKAYARSYFTNRGIMDRASDATWRSYLSDATLYQKAGKKGMAFAAVDTISNVYFNFKVNGTKMKLEIESDMSEILVDPGETRTSDEVLLIAKPWTEAQILRNKWIKDLTHTELKKRPVFGWCSWYTRGLKVTPKDIDDMIQFSYKHLDKLPFETIQVDDGWQVLRGIWTENSKFYNRLELISKKIKMLGMRPGLWLSPVRCDPIIGVCGNNEQIFPRDWFVKNYDGSQSGTQLDPTNPSVAKYIKESLTRWLEKGYTYFKLDFSQIGCGTKRFFNPKYTSMQAQRELFRIYRDVIGPDSYLLACGINDQHYLAPYVDTDRIGTDTSVDGGFARQKLATDNQPSVVYGFWYPILSMANKCYENGVLTNGDPDVTYTRPWGEVTLKQLQTFHSFVGIYAGSAMTSVQLNKPEFNTVDDIRMMEIYYPISLEKGHSFAGGWDMYGTQFGYEVNRKFGRWTNVVIWNPMHRAVKDLSISETPTPGKKFHVWSFWDEDYKGVCTNNYLLKHKSPYEGALLRLTALSSNPVIIGSNLHISMGTVELKDISFGMGKMHLELDPNAGARNGRIYIYSETELSMPEIGSSNVVLVKKDAHVYMLILTDRERNKPEKIEIALGKGDAILYKDFANTLRGKEMIEKSGFKNR